jgi:alkanesulfonate monooxygenase SsuD/methylene tetrahydromethanopterin reductase-like flavin-dependent oxidoreductase (luciferase family)
LRAIFRLIEAHRNEIEAARYDHSSSMPGRSWAIRRSVYGLNPLDRNADGTRSPDAEQMALKTPALSCRPGSPPFRWGIAVQAVDVPIYMAAQGPKARALAKEIADGLISLGGPAEGFETCLVSTNRTVLDDGEEVTSPRASTALKPLIALAYHHRYTTDPENVKALPNGETWLASVERVDENVRHLSIHRGHNLDISNGHDALVDVSAAKQMTFTGSREELRERLVQLEARGATGIIFGTSGYDVERELRAYAEIAGLR